MNLQANLLWTGGWDSTYRLVELSQREIVVQPIYVYGDNRSSERYERKAMSIILEMLKDDSRTKAKILPVKFVDKKIIVQDIGITAAYNRVYKKTKLGSQQEWISCLAKQYPNLEIGTEKTDESISKIMQTINLYGKIEKDTMGHNVFVANESGNDGDVLFGNLRFPIIHRSGPEMRDDIDRWGYSDVMNNIWFCHRPYYGDLCGVCHPCQLKIETRMQHLFSKAALMRYDNREKFLNKLILNTSIKINYYYNSFRNLILYSKLRKK